MKKYNLKKIIVILMSVSMILPLGACAQNEVIVSKKEEVVIEPMEPEEPDVFSFDIIGGKDVMPIAGIGGRSQEEYSFDGQSLPDFNTDEMFQKLADCGINLLNCYHQDYDIYPDRVFKALELGEKYNIGVFVWDGLIYDYIYYDHTKPLTLQQLDERFRAYADYPAFSGVYVVDEPGNLNYWHTLDGWSDIERYVPLFQNLKELGVCGFGNLFPNYLKDKIPEYHEYVQEWCETCEPMYLSFDHYVFDAGRENSLYFQNLDIIRKYAEKYEIPFWSVAQAGGQWNDEMNRYDSGELYPTEGQMHWNVNTSLAYGAKGIQYWPLLQSYYMAWAESTEMDYQRNGIFGANNNKTIWWHYAQKVNQQIAAVDEVLMNSVNKGVIVSGEQAIKETQGLEYIMDGTSWREIKNVKGDAMIGCYNYQGQSAFYVVNYDCEYAQKITLDLHGTYKLTVVQDTKESKVETNKLTLDMKAGEGVLVVVESSKK